jgi:cystathionine beta-lyase/cystathionine gamma-synthase
MSDDPDDSGLRGEGRSRVPPAPERGPRLGLGTRAVRTARGAAALGPAGERPHTPPLYQTTNFTYPDAAGALRASQGGAFIYGRHGNPTTDALATAVADLEGAEAGMVFASGMAATTTAVVAFAAGGEVVASEGIYGGSTELLTSLGPQLGISVRFVPAWDTEAVARALGPRTRLLLVETLTNPLLRVPDLPALGALARGAGVALMVDSTFASPVIARPLDHGATLVTHSVSKFIAGHGDVIGGVAVGAARDLERLRKPQVLLGGVMDPFGAWLALRGLRTLPLRVQRQCATAARLADALAGMPGVRRVHYPGRSDHPDHARARALLSAPGALVSFELADGAAAARAYDRLRVIDRAASLGEVSSLLTHPATFSHQGVPADERARLGIVDGLLRLSVGIEEPDDLEADLRQAIAPDRRAG